MKRDSGPISCQLADWRSNTGPIAKPKAGNVNAAAATAPVRWPFYS
ncbi:MAG TPA: hypothetical protein VIK30_12505 [Polyangia bacterium]